MPRPGKHPGHRLPRQNRRDINHRKQITLRRTKFRQGFLFARFSFSMKRCSRIKFLEKICNFLWVAKWWEIMIVRKYFRVVNYFVVKFCG